MVNVFGDSTATGSGYLQVVKKVVVADGTFVTPIRYYDGKV